MNYIAVFIAGLCLWKVFSLRPKVSSTVKDQYWEVITEQRSIITSIMASLHTAEQINVKLVEKLTATEEEEFHECLEEEEEVAVMELPSETVTVHQFKAYEEIRHLVISELGADHRIAQIMKERLK